MTGRDRTGRTWTPTWEKRGVSDVIAFVFVFSIIITSVGLVSAVGFKVLEDVKSDEQAVNAVRGMQTLGHNLGNVQRGHAPGRAGELKLANGKVYVRENSEIDVTITCTSPPAPGCAGGSTSFTFDMGTLYYDMDNRETNVTYENGAVFREDRDGSPVMVDEPRFICEDGEHAVISVVTLVSDEGAPGGSSTVQVIGREDQSTLRFANGTVDDVTITISDSRFTNAWEAHFLSNGWTGGGNTFTCDVGSDGKVFVRRTVINIEFVT